MSLDNRRSLKPLLNVLTLLKQQMLYNNVETFSRGFRLAVCFSPGVFLSISWVESGESSGREEIGTRQGPARPFFLSLHARITIREKKQQQTNRLLVVYRNMEPF